MRTARQKRSDAALSNPQNSLYHKAASKRMDMKYLYPMDHFVTNSFFCTNNKSCCGLAAEIFLIKIKP